MSRGAAGWVLPILAIVLIGAAAAMVIVITSSDGEDEPARPAADERRAEKEREIQRKKQQLEKALSTRRPARERPGIPAAARDREPSDDGEGTPDLTPAQRLALKSVLDGFYSPGELRDALRNRTAPEYAREVSQRYIEALESKEIDYGRGTVPVTPEVETALRRLGVVKDYVMNMLHTMRPEGSEELQQQMMDRMNDSLGRRIDQLNEDYPFLGVQKVESL